MYHNPTIEIRYFVDGYIKKINGFIHKTDAYAQCLHLYIVYINMTYKNTGNLITEYSKVCED